MDEKRALGYLGLAKKAGALSVGEFQTEDALIRHRAYAVVIAADASGNTKKKFRSRCENRKVPWFELSDRDGLGYVTGKEYLAVCAIRDRHLAEAFIKAVGNEEK